MPVEKGAEFIIELERTEGYKYGWQVSFTDDDSAIMVENVLEGGLIEGWNKQHEDSPLEPGDLIIDVNESRGEAMKTHLGLQAAKQMGPIKFVIKKGCADDVPPPKPLPPRWQQIASGIELSSWAPLGVVHYKSSIGEFDESQRLAVLFFFVFVTGIRLTILCCEYLKIKKVPECGVVEVPPIVWLGRQMTPGREATPQAYEMGMWKEHMKETALGAFVVLMIWHTMGNMLPIVMHIVRVLFKGFESPLFKVHILGKELTRPYGPIPLDWKGLQKESKKKD